MTVASASSRHLQQGVAIRYLGSAFCCLEYSVPYLDAITLNKNIAFVFSVIAPD